jgi:hypothetical protein
MIHALIHGAEARALPAEMRSQLGSPRGIADDRAQLSCFPLDIRPRAGFGAGAFSILFACLGAAMNPRLALRQGATVLRVNDDWGVSSEGGSGAAGTLSAAFTAIGAFPLNPSSKDAALASSLAAGAFTAEIEVSGASGLVLAELYDTLPQSGAWLINVSARAQVGQGDHALVAGFVISGEHLQGAASVELRSNLARSFSRPCISCLTASTM